LLVFFLYIYITMVNK